MKSRGVQGVEKTISLDLIDRPQRVSRFDIPEDEIAELAESIRERGLLQAITVADRDGRYEIVFGDRRFLACKKLDLEKIRCVVRKYADVDVAIDRATENNQRANLSPLEEAAEYFNLHEKHGMTWDQIGKMLGKAGGSIMRRVKVLKMDERIQRALHDKKITLGVAEELHRCPDQTQMVYLLEMCVEHGVTVMVARGWVDDVVSNIRRQVADIESGRGELEVYEPQKLFRACSLCQDPVDIMKMRRIEACPSCHDAIIKILREGG